MPQTPLDTNGMNDAQLAPRHAAARRTAWLFAGIAIAVYAAFILSGVLGAM